MKGNKFRGFLRNFSLATVLLTGCRAAVFEEKSQDHPNPSYKSVLEKIKTPEEEPQNYLKLSYKSALEQIKTPREAETYVKQLFDRAKKTRNFDDATHFYSPKQVHEEKPLDGSELAFSAAGSLSDDGHPSLVLIIAEKIAGEEERRHAVFVYKHQDKVGIIGLNQEGNMVLRREFDNVEMMKSDIISSFNEKNKSKGKYSIEMSHIDLEGLFGKDYINYDGDLKEILRKKLKK